ncbi:hypothetical protein CJ026_025930 [Ralstonia pickettii]|nr:hypothetical protein CJ026_025930 [Ralstonia pickettii]
MSTLTGTVALVTGASSGIGEATARPLAAEARRVIDEKRPHLVLMDIYLPDGDGEHAPAGVDRPAARVARAACTGGGHAITLSGRHPLSRQRRCPPGRRSGGRCVPRSS